MSGIDWTKAAPQSYRRLSWKCVALEPEMPPCLPLIDRSIIPCLAPGSYYWGYSGLVLLSQPVLARLEESRRGPAMWRFDCATSLARRGIESAKF